MEIAWDTSARLANLPSIAPSLPATRMILLPYALAGASPFPQE
jgi:hypothetical protein